MNRSDVLDDSQKNQALQTVFAVSGPEGYWMPGTLEECRTRDSALQKADEDAVTGRTALDPTLVLAIRMQTRLLELGLSVQAAAVACRALMEDVDQLLLCNGVEEEIRMVKVSEFQGGQWTPVAVARSGEWAEAPLWPPTWSLPITQEKL